MEYADRSQFKDVAFWRRTLYMVLFMIAYAIAEMIAGLIVVVQFVTILINGRANETLLRFGNSLSAYVRQMLRFVMYNTEQMPYPFSDWPQEPPEGDRWRGDPAREPDPVPSADPEAQDPSKPAGRL